MSLSKLCELEDFQRADVREQIRSVFGVLSRHISEGQVNKVREALPSGLKQSWIDAEQGQPAEMDA